MDPVDRRGKATSMRDASEVLDLDLHLPIRGKTYTVRPPSAADAATLMNLLGAGIVTNLARQEGLDVPSEAIEASVIPDDQEQDFGRLCLGRAYDEMITDDVPHPMMELAVSTAFLCWTTGSKELAEAWWDTGGKLPAPNRAQRRAQQKTATRTRSAVASTTPRPASASGTSSRKPRKKG